MSNDLISREKLKKAIMELSNDNPSYYYTGYFLDRERVIEEIDNAPTVAERPHGEWKVSQTMDCHSDIVNVYTCPFCGKKFYSAYPFCNCGADMRGEENEKT